MSREPAVLLVDDHADSLESCALFFRNAGLIVRTAESGGAALHLARALSLDVVVLDLEMPSMNGIEVLDSLRSRDSTAATPIVVFSGSPSQKYPGHRADAWVQKPCEPSRLLEIVRRVAAHA